MNKLNFHRFGVVWLKDKLFISSILTSDTFKKKLFKKIISKNLWLIKFVPFFQDKSSIIAGILVELDVREEDVLAVYVNKTRIPNRTYIWASEMSGRNIFIKILHPNESVDIPYERRMQKMIAGKIPNINTFAILDHGQLSSGSSFIVYESLDMESLRFRRQISEEEVASNFSELKVLHPDFNSENIFSVHGRFYVVDFEALQG